MKKMYQSIRRFLYSTALIVCSSAILLMCDKDGEPVIYLEESEHFILHTTSDHASKSEVRKVLEAGEILFEEISKILGPERTPTDRIPVHLEGDFVDQGPYVDFEGIHLFRYSKKEGGYLALLAHEIVHTFNGKWFAQMEAWAWPTYKFFDEGFAEFIAQKVDPSKQGFPFYGYPEDVVVGSLVASGNYIPFDTLRKHHDALNQKCNLQTYPQRASWFTHLDERFGREAVFAIVFPSEEPTSEVVKDLAGISLVELDNMWETWIISRFEKIANREGISAAYLNRVSWYKPCIAGRDY